MSDSQERPWSDNPNAPRIPYWLYLQEKSRFAGVFLGSILYGILVVLFFQCMAALFNPTNRRREGIRWWIVCYTVLLFSFATISTGTGLHVHSISYIDNREFPGVEGVLPPGPIGYWDSIGSGALQQTNGLMAHFGYWLADGFLLYRGYVIYSGNLWAIALPCLLYLGAVATGIVQAANQARGLYPVDIIVANSSLSVSFNVLLTLMIVIRLVLHGRNVRAATGSTVGISGLYKTISAMLIESCALYALNSLVLIGMRTSQNNMTYAFMATIIEVQTIAPLLIVKRVANKTALTSDTIVTGQISSFRVRSQRETGGSVSPASEGPVGLADDHGKSSVEFRVRAGAETALDFHRDKI